MWHMNVILIFAVFSPFVCIDSINGLWIPPYLGINHSDFQQRTSNKVILGDDIVKAAPTPSTALSDQLQPRIKSPVKQLSKETNETKDIKTTSLLFRENDNRNKETDGIKTGNDIYRKHEEETVGINALNVNDSFHSRIDNVTGYLTEQVVNTDAQKYPKKKFMGKLPLSQIFRRMFDPLGRLNRSRYFHSNHSRIQENLKKKTGKEEVLNITLTVHFEYLDVNETDMAMHNSSMTRNKADFLTVRIHVRFYEQEFVNNIFQMVLLAFMILLLSMAIGFLVLRGLFLIVVYLLYGLILLCKFFVLCCYSKNPLEDRHNIAVKTSCGKIRLHLTGYNKLVSEPLSV